jgi:hypothetical protein
MPEPPSPSAHPNRSTDSSTVYPSSVPGPQAIDLGQGPRRATSRRAASSRAHAGERRRRRAVADRRAPTRDRRRAAPPPARPLAEQRDPTSAGSPPVAWVQGTLSLCSDVKGPCLSAGHHSGRADVRNVRIHPNRRIIVTESHHHYWAEKLYAASQALVGAGSIQGRLKGAYVGLCRIHQDDKIPESAREGFAAWKSSVEEGLGPETGMERGRPLTLGDDQCEELAKQVVSWLFRFTLDE